MRAMRRDRSRDGLSPRPIPRHFMGQKGLFALCKYCHRASAALIPMTSIDLHRTAPRFHKEGLRNGVVKKRVFILSPSLTVQLHPFVEGRRADEPMFLTPGSLTKTRKRLGGRVRLEPDNFVKKALRPILKESGLDGAAHAFLVSRGGSRPRHHVRQRFVLFLV